MTQEKQKYYMKWYVGAEVVAPVLTVIGASRNPAIP